ncbi:hypothetical protein [Lactococcus petauri]|uniref:hypothetical protein n=1 Tax=Lactococcus petauri TaxID=1940789 RepID=UPI0030D19A19
MISKVRKTITGTEFWDSEKKRTLFVADGEEPDFKVGEAQEEQEEPEEKDINLNSMSVPQLKEYAASIEVEIPKELTKKKEILEFLQ